MNKKLNVTLITMLTLICLISGVVFAAPQSSPNVNRPVGLFKEWTYDNSSTKYISNMKGSTGTMGNAGNLDVHLQRNTEYGAMLILGLSDYGKQASSVSYSSLFKESSHGLATTTGNVSGIYNIGNNEHVAAGICDRYNYYLNIISSQNSDEYSTNTSNRLKNGDAMNLFGEGTATSSNWLRKEFGSGAKYIYYYGLIRNNFGWSTYKTYDESLSDKDTSISAYARAVVTQYN